MGLLLFGSVNQTIVLTNSADSTNMAENLKMAGLNTLIGLTVVFAVLTIIIFFISLFKIIPYLQNKAKVGTESVDNVLAQIVENEEEELVGDCELIAVITAAIHASMGNDNDVPNGGFVVRSIKRADSRRWINA